MTLKLMIDKLEDVEAALRSHYVEENGKFYLATQGEHPKVAEFRTTNVALLKERDDLRTRFEGIDPETVKPALAKLAELEKAKPDVRIAELETALATEKAANADAQKRATRSILRDTLRPKLLAAGALPAALDIALDKADCFIVVNDAVQAKPNTFSKTRPGEPITPDDWIADTVREFPFLFGPTTGGGSGPGNKNSQTSATELRDPTPADLGRYSAEIAAGTMRVVHSGGQ
jgi:hypothetical protein